MKFLTRKIKFGHIGYAGKTIIVNVEKPKVTNEEMEQICEMLAQAIETVTKTQRL